MSTKIFVGVDPGPVPGIVVLRVDGPTLEALTAHALQCTASIAAAVVDHLLADSVEATGDPAHVVLAVERFVIGRSSMKSAGPGAITRDMVGQLRHVATFHNVRCVLRSASEVKPWATDDRLAHARLLEPTKAMRHARDAARHALFSAVRDGGIPDPLSKRARA